MATISGGDKLASALAKISQNITKASTLSVGFLENATYPDGTSVALIAAINEYGAPSRGQPPRPFFRQMIASKSPEWPEAVASLLKANDYDAAATLEQTGAAIKGQLQDSIATFSGVPLSPKTIKRKGGVEKQLVDSGVMLASIDYIVKT